MTVLAWQRAGAGTAGTAVLVHAWGASGVSAWQDTDWVARLTEAGYEVLVCDLPGHGDSADVVPPEETEPAAWTASAALADLERLGTRAWHVVGADEGGVVAAHVTVRAADRTRSLTLIGCDDRAGMPNAAEVGAALRDPAARVWHPEAAEAVSRARRDRRHHLPTLAAWVEQARWPAAARLGALDVPVLVAVGAGDERRAGAPRLARLFHDGRLMTVPGDGSLATPELVSAVTRFVSAQATAQ